MMVPSFLSKLWRVIRILFPPSEAYFIKITSLGRCNGLNCSRRIITIRSIYFEFAKKKKLFWQTELYSTKLENMDSKFFVVKSYG